MKQGAIIPTLGDRQMKLPKTQTVIALAAALSLAGISAASAATMANGVTTKMVAPASDSLSLSGTQQHTAWSDLYVRSLNQKTPSGFDATVGAVVPNSVKVAPVTSRAAGDVPALKPYDFAMLQHKLLIVNPGDKKIAEVITR
jgi:hypothetical protein